MLRLNVSSPEPNSLQSLKNTRKKTTPTANAIATAMQSSIRMLTGAPL